MGSGATVQYVRFTTGGMLDPAYIDSLIAAAAAALTS